MSDKGVDSLVNQNNTPGAAVLFFTYCMQRLSVACWLVGFAGKVSRREEKLVSTCANAINLSVIILPLLLHKAQWNFLFDL